MCYLEINGKSYYGEFELLTRSKSFAIIRAQGVTKPKGFQIQRKDFLNNMNKFPDVKKRHLAEAIKRNRDLGK